MAAAAAARWEEDRLPAAFTSAAQDVLVALGLLSVAAAAAATTTGNIRDDDDNEPNALSLAATHNKTDCCGIAGVVSHSEEEFDAR